MSESHDTIVIGSGIGGLTAALTCACAKRRSNSALPLVGLCASVVLAGCSGSAQPDAAVPHDAETDTDAAAADASTPDASAPDPARGVLLLVDFYDSGAFLVGAFHPDMQPERWFEGTAVPGCSAVRTEGPCTLVSCDLPDSFSSAGAITVNDATLEPGADGTYYGPAGLGIHAGAAVTIVAAGSPTGVGAFSAVGTGAGEATFSVPASLAPDQDLLVSWTAPAEPADLVHVSLTSSRDGALPAGSSIWCTSNPAAEALTVDAELLAMLGSEWTYWVMTVRSSALDDAAHDIAIHVADGESGTLLTLEG